MRRIATTLLAYVILGMPGLTEGDDTEKPAKESPTLVFDDYSWPPALYGKLDTDAENPLKKLMEDLKAYLTRQGVTFPDGSTVAKGSPLGGFTMRNTVANHKTLEAHLLKVSEDHRQRRKIQNRGEQAEALKP